MKRFIYSLVVFVVSITAHAQGDDCSNAVNLGALNNPTNCPTGGSAPATVYNGTTVGATVENPYSALNCMDSPAADVWVTFTATGNVIDVNLTSGLSNANLGLYSGSSCAGLTGYLCASTTNGNASFSDVPVVPGQQYYLQISGASEFDLAAFTLTITPTNDCDICLLAAGLTASPPPVGGFYLPNTTVTFCLEVSNFEQIGANWLSGVVPSLSSNWNTTMTPVSAPPGDADYSWFWSNSGPNGAGFYVDEDELFFGFDGDFTNNFGDPTIDGTGSWEFCFQATTNSICVPGGDLGISINTLSDYETGGYGTPGCADDPEILFSAEMQCCDIPTISSVATTCQGDADGSASVQGQGGTAPYDYYWENSSGANVSTQMNINGVSTLSGLAAGLYTVTVIDATGCEQIIDVNVVDGPPCGCHISYISMGWEYIDCETNFTMTASVDYSNVNLPTSGDLVVEDCDGNIFVIDSYPFPVGTGDTIGPGVASTTFTGPLVQFNDFNCDFTFYFTADPSCTQVSTVSFPGVDPPDEAGTFSETMTGDSQNEFILCDGDQVDVMSNLDFFIPIGASPGLCYLIYSCPPTPLNPGDNPGSDPCLEYIVVGDNITVINNGGSSDPLISGMFNTPTDNTFYIVPFTLTDDSSSPLQYRSDCYDHALEAMTTVQYLNPITPVIVQDCQAGTATITLTGGYPEFYPELYTASNLSGTSGSFVNTTVSHGGTITITGLTNGNNWSFDIVDANGCPQTISGTFTGVTSSAFTYPQSAYCKNAANPSPIISGVGGGNFSAAPGGLVINPSTGVINMAASTVGTYTVSYTSPGAPCNSTSTFDITINPLPVVVVPNASMCVGGSAVLNASGADTYTWSPGASLSATTGSSVTATPATTTVYTITGTITATGCVGSTTATVTVNPLPTIGGTLNACVGNTSQLTGSATANASTPWVSSSPGVATVNATGLVTGVSAGTTDITYTNSNGCQVTVTFTVNPLPTIVANDVSVCVTGTVNVTAAGANTYTWSPGTNLSATTGATVVFTPGTTTNYTVTGTDANGCTNTDPVTVTVLSNAPIVASNDVTICNGAQTNISAAGGVSYTWNQGLGAGQNFNVSPTTTTTYTVTGTDANGCVGTDQVIVTVSPVPTVNAVTNQTVCANSNTTAINFSSVPAGASFTWTNSNSTIGLAANGSGNIASFTGLNAGATDQVATITVTPTLNGCPGTPLNFTITVNPLPTVNAVPNVVVCAASATTQIDFGSNLTGTTYSWTNSNPAIGLAANGNGSIASFTATNGGAAPITATITVTPTTNGCTGAPTNFTITVNPLPTATISGTASVCEGGTSPVITFTGANGVAPYTFTYNINGAGQTTITSTGNTATINVPSTPVGTYNYNLVSVVDASSTACSQNQAGTATITVNPNPSPVITGATEYCAGTTATISTTVPYTTYNWSTGAATPSVQVTDADNPITVTVTNANGCSATSAAYTVNENTVITYNIQVEICQGGSAVIHGNTESTAGVYSQTFVLPTGCDSTSNVTLIVNPLPAINAGTDITVCDGQSVTLNGSGAPTLVWSPMQTNGVPFNQAVGTVTYTVTGTDANGCQNTDDVDVTVNPLPTVNPIANQTICANTNTAAVNFTSAPPGSTFSWTNSNTSIGLAANGNGSIGAFSGQNAGSTPIVGTINVTPTLNGCAGTPANFTITVNPLLSASIAGTASVCLNGTSPVVTFTGSNGVAPYTFNYTLNGTPNSIVSTGNAATINAPTGTAGVFNYSLVSVSDASTTACSNTVVGTATITVNALPVVNAGADQTACLNDNVTLTASGAVSYVWSPSITNGVAFVPSLGSQNYTVTGTDGNGCVNTDIVNVTVNPLPTIVAGPDIVICLGDQATLTGSGGGAGAVYNWTAPVVDGTPFSPLATATYTVTGTDANGCQNTDDVVVTVQPLPAINAGNDLNGCESDDFILTGSGGGVGATYTWDNGVVNGQSFNSPVGTTTYTVTGTDIFGCENTDQVNIIVEEAPVVSFDWDQAGNCAPVTVTFTNTSVPAGVNCVWTFDDGSVVNGCGPIVHTFTSAGTYGASLQTETALSGCVGSVYYADIIVVEANPIASFTATPDQTTTLNTEVHFTNTSIGATNYSWDFGDNSALSNEVHPVHLYDEDEVGTYYVTLIATTPGGCADTAQLLIRVDEELIYYVPNTFTPDRDEFNEVFQPVFNSGFDPYNFSMWIFNRWGEVVFETHDASIGWDGTYGGDGNANECQDGTYTWKIAFKTTRNDERKVIHGHVNLLR